MAPTSKGQLLIVEREIVEKHFIYSWRLTDVKVQPKIGYCNTKINTNNAVV
jgi:hypothetical protein